MKRWIKTTVAPGGGATVKVTLVDGELSANATEKSYTGDIGRAAATADKRARAALEEMRVGLDEHLEVAS